MASSGLARLSRVRGLLLGWHRAEQGGGPRANGRPVNWEREFFSLAGSVLACRLAALDPGPLPDGNTYCPFGVIVGELAYGAEMHLVMREAGMLPRQRLARLARRLGL
jgi:hypothetical protein